MATSYGNNLKISIYGGSHDERIGVKLTGFPKGFQADLDALQKFLARRAPGNSDLATPRKEADEPVFLVAGGQTYEKIDREAYALPKTEELIQKVLDTQEAIYAAHPAVIDGSSTQGISIHMEMDIFNSKGLDLHHEGNASGLIVAAVVSDGKEMADLITLEVLPNEGATVGDIYDTDDESFCGCFNQCIRYLQENTKAQIVVIIMILGNDTPPEVIKKRGITGFEFAGIAERVAHLNGVPVINAFAESGFGYARVKARDYQKDHIHLNKLGGKNMGKFVWSKLKDIPAWEAPTP
jgi:hypothetical protein